MSGQRQTQRDRIIRLLVEARGGWVPLPRILDLGIAQYSARIFELRRLGFAIDNKTATDPETGKRHSWFGCPVRLRRRRRRKSTNYRRSRKYARRMASAMTSISHCWRG
jgi:hypothetical protein